MFSRRNSFSHGLIRNLKTAPRFMASRRESISALPESMMRTMSGYSSLTLFSRVASTFQSLLRMWKSEATAEELGHGHIGGYMRGEINNANNSRCTSSKLYCSNLTSENQFFFSLNL